MVHKFTKTWVRTTNLGDNEFNIFKEGNKYVAYIEEKPVKSWDKKSKMEGFFKFHTMKSLLL